MLISIPLIIAIQITNHARFAPTRWRGAMMAAVFSMQGAGQFVAAIIALVVTICFRDSFTAGKPSDCDFECRVAADRCWRIIVGTGALPALFALYYRITIPETPRYTFDVAHDIEKANADIEAFKHGQGDGQVDALKQQRSKQISSSELSQPRASWADFFEYFGNWKNGSLLFATMASWFFLDLAFYGLGLNNTIVLEAIGYSSNQGTIYRSLFNTAVGNLILVCAGSLPGYWLSVILMDTLGRRPIQIGGFAILTLLFCVIGFGYYSLSQGSLLSLYILAQFFFNFGPNTTTFIIPGECYPTRYRSTGHGLSAASGKIGAVVAQLISAVLLTKDAPAVCNGNQCSPWLPHLMEIFACFMLCGTLVSLLIPETKRKTLEELAGEKPLYQRNRNSTGSHGPGKGGFLTPVLGVLHSPKLNPMNGKKSNSGKSSEDGMGRSNGSVTSEAAILHGHNRTHSSGSDHNYVTNSVARTDGGLFWMESIPLQDVGGLMGGR
jgi:MFS transporter, PHS family, inorganic phosphate transporter